MFKNQKIIINGLIILIAIGILAFVSWSITQNTEIQKPIEIKENQVATFTVSEDLKIYKIDIQPNPGTQINKGVVIAYGHYLKPPYDITLDNSVIFINGIQCNPPLPKPQLEKKKGTVSPYYIKRHEIRQKIFSNYKEWVSKYGEEKAKELLVDFLKKQDIIDDFKFNKYDNLWIKWEGQIDSEEILIETALTEKPNKTELGRNIAESMKKTFSIMKSNLEKNGVIIVTYSEITLGSSEKLKRSVKKIDEIMRKNVDRNTKEKLLYETLGEKPDLVKSIIHNYNPNEWSDLEDTKEK
ncbi:MAG: hypothetical protein AAB732_02140 [Patescibacteria group bacterium]